MQTYTVENNEGKQVTFEWNDKAPPTNTDMEQVFAAAAKEHPKSSGGASGSWEEADFLTPPPGETQLSQGKPIRKAASNIYTPALEMAGLAVGGVGYAAGKDIARGLDEFTGLNEGRISIGENIKRAATDVVVGGALSYGGKMLGELAGPAIESVVKGFKEQNAIIKNTVEKYWKRGIKPSVVGKKTAPQQAKYYNDASDAVKSVIERREFNEPLPQTVEEFSQQLHNTKLKIWKDSHGLAVNAGKEELKTDLVPVISDIKSIANTPNINRLPGNTAAKLNTLAKKLEAQPTNVAPEEAEALLGHYNDLAKAFWKDPNPNSVHMAINYERIASNIRKALEKSIPEGAEYTALRKKYGSILATEKDVGHRAIVVGRQNAKGFFDLADIAGTGTFVHGLLTLNPATAVSGLAVKAAAKQAKKYANNQDRIVKKMFQDVEKLIKKLPPENTIPKAVLKDIPKDKPQYSYNPEFKGAKSPRPASVSDRLKGKMPMGQYKTPMDVREAFDRKKISGEEAELILTQKFGYEK